MTTESQQDIIIRRNLRRDQPVKLTQDELLEKMKAFTVKDAEHDELADELARETKKRKQQLEELSDEIGLIKRCIRTGEEDRSVPCYERLDRRADGTWEVVLIRADTNAVVERRGASAAELQRNLPTEYSGQGGSVLDDARSQQQAAAQRSAGGDDVPSEDDAPDDDSDTTEGDAQDGDDEPAEKPSRFDADALAKGQCALRASEGGSPCVLKADHRGVHKNEQGWGWKARRPKLETVDAEGAQS